MITDQMVGIILGDRSLFFICDAHPTLIIPH